MLLPSLGVFPEKIERSFLAVLFIKWMLLFWWHTIAR